MRRIFCLGLFVFAGLGCSGSSGGDKPSDKKSDPGKGDAERNPYQATDLTQLRRPHIHWGRWRK